MIADWYKRQGYHFLAISDHNVMQEGTRWFEIKQPVSLKGEVVQRGGGAVLDKYLARFGAEWVERRTREGKQEVRLKPLSEYRSLLEEPGRFLMIPSEVLGPPAEETRPRRTPPHRRYSRDVGTVLAEVTGPQAEYTLRGDEVYVRAKIVSSKPKDNGSVGGEFETAWTQPVVVMGADR